MLDGRWSQENAFTAMDHNFDIDWTKGYAHEPAAATPVPNPEVRRLKRRLGERTVQLRRGMDRADVHRTPVAAAARPTVGHPGGHPPRDGSVLWRQSVMPDP